MKLKVFLQICFVLSASNIIAYQIEIKNKSKKFYLDIKLMQEGVEFQDTIKPRNTLSKNLEKPVFTVSVSAYKVFNSSSEYIKHKKGYTTYISKGIFKINNKENKNIQLEADYGIFKGFTLKSKTPDVKVDIIQKR